MLIFLITILFSLNQQDGWFYLYTLRDTISPVTEVQEESESGENITLRGSKTISISTGSDGELQIQQGLRLTIDGNIGKLGEIQGVVNDNSDAPTGVVSRTLSGFSEIYLKYLYRNFTWSFGKINLTTDYYSSPMLGGMMEYRGEDSDIKFAYGEVPGVYRIRTFTGITNPALPLKITDNGEQIVSGTIRVYLNGNPLKENKDFSVDYITGTIYFLPGVEIKPDDRLRVEYISSESFGRKWLTGVNLSLRKEFYSLNLNFIQEADDRAYWLDNLGSEAIDSLKDKEGRVMIPAWRFVGEGQGDYDLLDSIFVYRGEGEGSYSVSFTYVGLGKGDYRFNDAGGFFYFAGKGMGDYTPFITITPPLRRRKILISSSLKRGGFVLKGGTYISLLKKNLFSNSPESQNLDGFAGLEYRSRALSWKLLAFQTDSVGFYLADDLEDQRGRGFLGAFTVKKFKNLEPGIEYSKSDEATKLKLWLRGRSYRIYYEKSDSTEKYGGKVLFSAGAVRAYFGGERFYSEIAYDQIYGGANYVPYLKLKTSRKFFYDGKVEDDLNVNFQNENLTLGYRLIKTSPGDSLFQSILCDYSGFTQNIGYSLRFRYREDLQKDVSFRYIYVGDGNGNYSYDSTSGRFYRDPLGSYERQVMYSGQDAGIKSLFGDLALNISRLSLKFSGTIKFSNKVTSRKENFYLTYSDNRFYGNFTKVFDYHLDEENVFEDGTAEYRHGQLIPGIRYIRSGGTEMTDDRYIEIYGKFRHRKLQLKLGSFFRPSYPPGLSAGFSLGREILSGFFQANLDFSYVSAAPAGAFPPEGMSFMYSLNYSHRFLASTGGNLELRGRKQKGRHIYTLRFSLSIEF